MEKLMGGLVYPQGMWSWQALLWSGRGWGLEGEGYVPSPGPAIHNM